MFSIPSKTCKILFLADTHLGFDLPMRPRIQRRRRGDDFFKNYYLALQPAFQKQVDLTIHGGDLFFRSRVHPKIVNDAFVPLLKIADHGIPVFIVPGNHERSNIPQSLLETHPMIHIFDKPKTFYLTKNLAGRSLGAPVLYPGAIERTSFVERAEPKGYLIIEVGFVQNASSLEIKWTFHELPTRPMSVININFDDMPSQNLQSVIKQQIADLDPHSIVQLRFHSWHEKKYNSQIKLSWLRSIVPATMNIEITPTLSTIANL